MQLIIGNSIIPLNSRSNLSLVKKSPLFVTPDNYIPGSYIFNFSVPAGDAIRAAFGQAHRVQRLGRAMMELPYQITDGSLRFAGNCIVTQATPDSYEIACKVDNGDLAGRLNGKTLKDLDWGADKEIANFCCAAYNQLDVVHSTNESLSYPLGFPTIYVDLNNNFSYFESKAYNFISKHTGVLKISLQFRITEMYMKNRELRLYKNGILYQTFYLLYGVNTQDITLDVVPDDNFLWTIYSDKTDLGYLSYILNDVFVDFHGNNLFNDTVLLDQDTSDFAIFPIHNKSLLDNFPDDAFQLDNLSIKTIYSQYAQVINYWINDEFPLFMKGYVDDDFVHCANLFTPFVYLKTILNKIAFEAGYTIENNPFDQEFKDAVLFNAFAENNYAINTTSILPVNPNFNLVDHVPEMAQSDFLKWVSIFTGYMPVVDNNLLTITFVSLTDKHLISVSNPSVPFPGILLANPLVKVDPEYKGIKFELKKAGTDKYLENIKELNDKLIYKGELEHTLYLPISGNTVNDMYLITSLNEYWVFQYDSENYQLAWCFFSKKFPLIYTEGEDTYLTIATELCPVLTNRMHDETVGDTSNRYWTIPRTEQSGILEGFPDSMGSEYGQQVLYYKGLVMDSLFHDYPLGSSRKADYVYNNDSFPDLSADSIMETRYKNWLRWLAYETKLATYRVIFTRAELAMLKFDQIYSAPGFYFLIKEIRVDMTSEGLSVAEIDIYTC